MLYFAAIERSTGYHYYIFLDEDVVLPFKSFARPEIKRLLPLRVFEKWLLDYEPVVGVLDHTGLHRYMFTAVELKFRGQALMFVPVTAGNPTHRSYPKSLKDIMTYWRDCIETIREKAPLVYRNRSLFENFRRSPEVYVIKTKTYCMNVTRHQSITAYAHFESQPEI